MVTKHINLFMFAMSLAPFSIVFLAHHKIMLYQITIILIVRSSLLENREHTGPLWKYAHLSAHHGKFLVPGCPGLLA